MVDAAVFARKVAAIRDAVARIRDVVPETSAAFLADRTAREVVTLNLFLALQETIGFARPPGSGISSRISTACWTSRVCMRWHAPNWATCCCSASN